MATDLLDPAVASPRLSDQERLIVRQLNKTRAQVKLVDLFRAVLWLVIGVLGYLLVVAVVDHWVVSLGSVGRWTALGVLVAGILAYVGRFVLPLFIRSVNPTFAAKTIEATDPSLKNSLVNYLQLRSQRSQVREVVFQALEQRAAADLADVPVETVVDRAPLIHTGYVLAAVMVLCAAYALVSPKSSLQTVRRVISPWADIARPSRVQIEDLQPGDTTVYHGTQINVSAVISGLADDAPARLFYSSLDGQVVEQSLPLVVSADGLRRECLVPPTPAGIQQDLIYRIEAGDAVTREHRLTVIPAPTILVERVEYDFPAYTKRPRQVVERQGDLHGLEGTRVTIHARANQPIGRAYLEFDPRSSRPGQLLESVAMTADGQTATGTLTLELRPDRRMPWHTSYQVRFTTADGQKSQQPVAHQIEVVPDLPPEVEILTPESTVTDVPANGQQKIEVRALDPDFGLSKMRLRFRRGITEIAAPVVFEHPTGQAGQTLATFVFRPVDHKLNAGDEVFFRAEAEDNRATGRPGAKPNTTQTAEYQLRITAAAKVDGDRRGNGAGGKPDDANQPGAEPREDPKGGANADDPAAVPKNQPGKPKSSSGSGGKTGQDQKTDNETSTKRPKGAGGSSEDANPNQSESKSGGSSSGASGSSSSGDQSSGKKGGSSGAGSSSQQGSSGKGKPGSESTGESGSQAGSKSDGSTGGEKHSDASGSSGSKAGSSGQSGGASSGQRSGSGEQGGGEKREEPLHDGEAFERILEHLKEQKQQGGSSSSEGGSSGSRSGQSSAGEQSGGEQSGEKPSSGNQSASPSGSSASTPSSGQKGASPQSSGAGQQQSGSQANGTPSSGSQSEGSQSSSQQNAGKSTPQSSNDSQSSAGNSAGKDGEGQQNAGNKSPSGQQSGGQTAGNSKPGNPAGGQDSGGGQSGSKDNQNSSNQSNQQSGQNQSGQSGNQQGPMSGGQSSQNQQQSGGGQQPQASQKSGSQSPSQSGGQGSQSQKDGSRQPNGQQGGSQQQGSQGQQSGQPKSGQQQGGANKDGQSGSGQKSEDQSGGGGGNQDQDKQKKQQGGGQSQSSGGAPSPSNSPKQSDSQGGESGDRSGGGGKGGGQNAKQAGNDSSGQSGGESEGAGNSSSDGSGSSSSPGSKQTASGSTGNPSSTEGQGRTSDGQKGTQPGSKPRGSQSPDPTGTRPQAPNEPRAPGNADQPQNASEQQAPGSAAGTGGQGVPLGGGLPSDNQIANSGPDGEVPEGEKANLEYARRATDMALEYLKNQKHSPDPKLLEKLGWTPDDLRNLADRWDKMKRGAKEDPRGAKEFNDSLRSLGLRTPSDRTRRVDSPTDSVRGLRDIGGRSQPPSKYADQFNAFKKGAARSASER